MRVLVAENDFLRAAALHRIASTIDETERCDLAHSAQAAERIAANTSPDLVLLGLTFTELDGLDLIEILAADLPSTRLVVIAEPRDERTRAVLRHTARATYLDPTVGPHP